MPYEEKSEVEKENEEFHLPDSLFFVGIIYRRKRFIDDVVVRHRLIEISIMKEENFRVIILSNASAVVFIQISRKTKKKIK